MRNGGTIVGGLGTVKKSVQGPETAEEDFRNYAQQSRILSARADHFAGSEMGRKNQPAPFEMTVLGRFDDGLGGDDRSRMILTKERYGL